MTSIIHVPFFTAFTVWRIREGFEPPPLYRAKVLHTAVFSFNLEILSSWIQSFKTRRSKSRRIFFFKYLDPMLTLPLMAKKPLLSTGKL